VENADNLYLQREIAKKQGLIPKEGRNFDEGQTTYWLNCLKSKILEYKKEYRKTSKRDDGC